MRFVLLLPFVVVLLMLGCDPQGPAAKSTSAETEKAAPASEKQARPATLKESDKKVSKLELVVVTSYPGAGPEEVEQGVTLPIESALGALPGVTSIASRSEEGLSRITLTFSPDVEPLQAQTQLFEKLQDLRPSLPEEVATPSLRVVDAELPGPTLLLLDADRDLLTLTALAETVRAELLRGQDVGSVELVGGRSAQWVVALDSTRLAAFGLSPGAVFEALEAAAAGLTPQTDGDSLHVRTNEINLDGLRSTPVAQRENSSLRLEDVAELSVESVGSYLRVDGQPKVGLQLSLRRAHALDSLLAAAVALLPSDVRLTQLPASAHPPLGVELAGADANGLAHLVTRLETTLGGLAGVERVVTSGDELHATIEVFVATDGAQEGVDRALADLLRDGPGLAHVAFSRPGRQLVVTLTGADRAVLSAAAQSLATQELPAGVRSVTLPPAPLPELQLSVDQERIAQLGVTTAEVTTALRMISGVGLDWPGAGTLLVKLGDIEAPTDLVEHPIFVRGAEGLVALSELAEIAMMEGAPVRERTDGRASLELVVDLEAAPTAEQSEWLKSALSEAYPEVQVELR